MERPGLLLISYLFPPAGGIAVQRALSLAKYLPECGFDVHVLHAWNAASPVRDPGLLRHLPGRVTVHSAFTPEVPFTIRQKLWHRLRGKPAAAGGPTDKPVPTSLWKRTAATVARRVFCPEPEVLWTPFAVRKAWQVIRKYRIGTVLITAPPFSSFLVGVELKKRAPHLTLVSDFRDEWLDFYLKDFDFQSGEHTRRRAAEIERWTVEASDLVVSTTVSTRNVMRRRYATEPDDKFAVVSNGYDPELVADFHPRSREDGRMLVTHVGTVYRTASPRYYLDAVDHLPEPLRERVTTRFVGRVAEDEQRTMNSRRSQIDLLGFLPQEEAVRYIEDTDYLLLTMTDDVSIPGKLYEYMATGKPILAMCSPKSEVARILEETGAGLHADPRNTDAVRALLVRAWGDIRRGASGTRGTSEAVRRYERPRLAAQYADLMRALSQVPGAIVESRR